MLHVFPDTEDDKAIIMSLTYGTASLFTESLADSLIKSIDYKKKKYFCGIQIYLCNQIHLKKKVFPDACMHFQFT